MLTLDQIKNVTFTKVRGGYATTEVDDFIDQCVDTVAGLIEERNTSNKKLEVLADKLVEYRSEEDSIRSVLLDARRMADSTLREASQKAALTLEDARIKAEKTVADAQTKAKNEVESVSGEVEAQKAELARLKQEVAAFKHRMLSIYREHLSLIDVLPEEPVQPEKPAEPTTEEEPETPTEALEETPAKDIPQPEEESDEIAESAEEQPAPGADPAPEQPAVDSGEESAVSLRDLSLQDIVEQKDKPKENSSRFGDLKFGDDYVIGEDTDSDQGHGFFRRKK